MSEIASFKSAVSVKTERQ